MKQLAYSTLFCIQLMLLNFAVKAQDVSQLGAQKPFVINGTFGIGLGTYSASGIDPREHSFSYLFSGAPVISIYGVSFPFSIVVSDQQRGFRQPFNQYGISPTYKWVTLHLGWQSIQWSEFTMAGYNLLGAGVELNPGKLRLGFVYGRFNKAIEETSVQPLSFQTPAYLRTGYSARVGYGTDRNHLDFTFLNIKDDANSLKNIAAIPADLRPAENVALGIDSRWSFLSHFVWSFEVAGSIYTRDKLSDTLDLHLEKLNFLKKMITINASTQLLTAAKTSIDYQNKNYNVGLQYRRIDPDYKSMGAYYFETDVANYTVQGGWRLLKNQVQLTGSLGFQQDNIRHDKAYTSHRDISSLGVSYNSIKYGIDLRYSNYGVTQDRGLNPVIDTFRVARTNYNVNAMLRYSIPDTLISHNFILIGNIQSLVDLNHFTSGQNETNSKTANLAYQLAFNKSAFSINTNFSYTIADIVKIHTIIYGPSFGIGKQLDNGKLGLNASFTYQLQRNNSIDAGNVINGAVNGSYRFSKRDGVNLSLSYLKSNSKDVTLPSFNEFRSSLNLTHTF
ncbi:hypothetical protein KXD93_01195 [Mucilaginibacter sp. BJC16-A38]|uniref:hypothetical protein n=1 Tax=Mucilaginibacter phenanthrenivorans TaxID=1234842 RepID=UPI002157E4FE|nr:hypothetical protein [Mucilaginibacter phenanthrenivorans]MCR8556235.1 hypothetical protein [Mucilaginibacter phenanthrenivorans]